MDTSSQTTPPGNQDTSSPEVTDLAQYFDNGPQESTQTSSDEASTTTVEEAPTTTVEETELPSKKETLAKLL
jgi:hypothetical protein